MPAAMPAHATGPAGTPARVDPLVALADRCVQCGLCLPACPTYAHGRVEAESPRGRIALARALASGSIEPTATIDRHLDQCLGCRSCEAVCPAGVQFGALLVEARTRQRARRGAAVMQRLAEIACAHARLLTIALAAYRRAYPALPRAWRRLPRPPARPPAQADPIPVPAAATAAATAAVFSGCAARAYEPAVRAALRQLLRHAGVALVEPRGQGCCGALHAHAGDDAAASRLATANAAAFAGQPAVLTLASGCHESLAAACASPVVDALEYLEARAAALHFHPLHERIALHLPCTQRNVVGSVPALRRLLARVPGLEVVELDRGLGCCGAAGSAMLTDPARAGIYRQPLLDQLAGSGASRLLSANIGCRLHMSAATSLPVQHPLELLAEALSTPAPVDHR